MRTILKKNEGFSLVELMVVIAIIGVLATIAIPKYNVFIAKSRTSEAQSNLAGIYSFNKNFFTEYNGYTSSLDAMGFRAEGKLRYNTGFAGAAACPANFATQNPNGTCAGNTNTLTMCPNAGVSCSTLKGATNADPGAPTSVEPAGTFATFTAGANAQITANAASDQWQITESKNLTHLADGTGG